MTSVLIIERSQERRALAAQASRNVPELAFWEEHLAMKIEGVREDVLRVVFSHIKENDWTREYSFIIDLAERDYKSTTPGSHSLTKSSNVSRPCPISTLLSID